MGLINYLGESKVIKKICELLNVKDVKVNGTSVVDASGDGLISIATGDDFGSLKVGSTDISVKMKAFDITTSGTDLNNYKTEGMYYFNYANSPSNVPVANSYGVLWVISYASNSIKQIWFRHATAEPLSCETYIRTYRSSVWGSWQKFLFLTGTTESTRYLKKSESSGNTFILQGAKNTWYNINAQYSNYHILIGSNFGSKQIKKIGGDDLTVTVDSTTGEITMVGSGIRNSTNVLVEENPN